MNTRLVRLGFIPPVALALVVACSDDNQTHEAGDAGSGGAGGKHDASMQESGGSAGRQSGGAGGGNSAMGGASTAGGGNSAMGGANAAGGAMEAGTATGGSDAGAPPGTGGTGGTGGVSGPVREAGVDASIDASSGLPESGVHDATLGDGATLGSYRKSCARMQGTECAGEGCCASSRVLGGTFMMGRSTTDGGTDTAPGSANEVPEHSVTVSSFRLDDFEVTVGRLRRFVDAYDGTPPAEGAGANPHIPNSGWQSAWNSALPTTQQALRNALFCSTFSTWTTVALTHEALPMNCVTWYEAAAFCAWDGGRLPTEAEWEYAAAGGSENRLYPWGAEIPDDTNGLAVIDCAYAGTPGSCTTGDIAPVGTFPLGKGRYGQLDLAGSMRELVLDWYDPLYYGSAEGSGTDVADLAPTQATYRVIRGGNFITPGSSVRSVSRSNVLPTSRFDAVGFRCAHDD